MTHEPAMAVPFILCSVVTAICAQIAMKSAMNRVGPVRRTTTWRRWRKGAPQLAAGLLLYAVSTVCWLTALARVELSFAFPFVSLSYVGIALGARFFFRERLTAHRMLGSAMIVAGVLLVSLSG